MESWWVPAPAERRRNVTLVSGAAVLPSPVCSCPWGAPTAVGSPCLGLGSQQSQSWDFPTLGIFLSLVHSHSWIFSIPGVLSFLSCSRCWDSPTLGYFHPWLTLTFGIFSFLGRSLSWAAPIAGIRPSLGFFPSLGCSNSCGVQPCCDPPHTPPSHRTVPRALRAAWRSAAPSTASSALLC